MFYRIQIVSKQLHSDKQETAESIIGTQQRQVYAAFSLCALLSVAHHLCFVIFEKYLKQCLYVVSKLIWRLNIKTYMITNFEVKCDQS